MDVLWRVELFGGLQLIGQDRHVSRFQTYKTGALLGYLCSHTQIIPRDVLVELLWPDAELDAARNSLRVALNSLRRQLEPPGVPMGAVLITSRSNVQLNRDVVVTDVQEFETFLQKSSNTVDESLQKEWLLQAVARYQGPFLPGYYEDWITPERLRLSDAYAGALRRLTRALVQARELDSALDIARRALVADPLHESSHCNLMQLYVALGKPAAAAQQYRELEILLREQLNEEPSANTRALVRKLALNLDQTPTLITTQILAAPRSDEPPALRMPPPAVQEGYLPPQLTRFFGREEELQQLREQLGDRHSRLITLTGLGGIGKTRLAIEAAESLRLDFQGRVWFVALADANDRERMIGTIASALNLPRQPETDPLQQILRYLRDARTLLLLDNLEQIVAVGADLVEMLLRQIPDLTILVTSRQTLDVTGEREIPLEVLRSPHPNEPIEALMDVPSVQLFRDRAQAVRPDFQITLRNGETIALLCARLEGLPLAIELAAAWAQTLTPAQMLERLEARFDLLVSTRRDRSPRQRTLRNAIDWSYQLLEPALQRLFTCLSIFQGGWTLEAAQRVCDEPDALTRLHELQQRSLLSADSSLDEIRFRMLGMIREYAAEHLSPSDRSQLAEAHARYFLQEVQRSEVPLQQSEAALTVHRFEIESDNIHAAIAWCVEHSHWTEAVEMGAVLWRFWNETAQVATGRYWTERICSEARAYAAPAAAALFHGAGRLAATENDLLRAEAFFEWSLLLAQQCRDQDLQTHVYANLTLTASARGDKAAVVLYMTESLRLNRQSHCRWKLAYSLSALAEAHLQQGDYAAAEGLFTESAALRREIGDRCGEVEARAGRNQALRRQGRDEEADREDANARESFSGIDEPSSLTATFLNLGTMAWDQGDYRVAASLFTDALALFEECADTHGCAFVLECLGEIAVRQRDLSCAAALSERCLRLYQDQNNTAGMIAALRLSREIATARNDRIAATAFSRQASRLQRKADTPAEVPRSTESSGSPFA